MCCYSLSSQAYSLAARSYRSYSILKLAAHVYRSRLQYAITNCSISRLTAITLRSISSDRASDLANNTILGYRSTLEIFNPGVSQSLLPSAGRGCGAFEPDNSGDALPPTESLTDPRLDSRPVRIDAPRTAYREHLPSDQPPSGDSTVCIVPPRTQAHAVTRDSRNRARRKRKVRSPYPHEEKDRANFHIRCGNSRTASRTPIGFTRGPTPPISDTYNHYQLDFMNQDASVRAAPAVHRPCTQAAER